MPASGSAVRRLPRSMNRRLAFSSPEKAFLHEALSLTTARCLVFCRKKCGRNITRLGSFKLRDAFPKAPRAVVKSSQVGERQRNLRTWERLFRYRLYCHSKDYMPGDTEHYSLHIVILEKSGWATTTLRGNTFGALCLLIQASKFEAPRSKLRLASMRFRVSDKFSRSGGENNDGNSDTIWV